jgi:hypothetical protein
MKVDEASQKGKIGRRFLNNDFIFDSVKNLECNLVKNFSNNLTTDFNDFIYLYMLFTSSEYSILEEQDFSLREDLEDGLEVEQVNTFFGQIADFNLHSHFEIGLDI